MAFHAINVPSPCPNLRIALMLFLQMPLAFHSSLQSHLWISFWASSLHPAMKAFFIQFNRTLISMTSIYDPWFVVEEAANLPGWDNTLPTKPNVFSDTLSEALNVITKVLLKHLPVGYPVAYLQHVIIPTYVGIIHVIGAFKFFPDTYIAMLEYTLQLGYLQLVAAYGIQSLVCLVNNIQSNNEGGRRMENILPWLRQLSSHPPQSQTLQLI